jgi:hypothetical protein
MCIVVVAVVVVVVVVVTAVAVVAVAVAMAVEVAVVVISMFAASAASHATAPLNLQATKGPRAARKFNAAHAAIVANARVVVGARSGTIVATRSNSLRQTLRQMLFASISKSLGERRTANLAVLGITPQTISRLWHNHSFHCISRRRIVPPYSTRSQLINSQAQTTATIPRR